VPRLRERAVVATDAPTSVPEESVGARSRTPLLGLPEDLPAGTLVAVDTETSGLHPDDGATVAVVSVGWRRDGEVVARAFPFDQERWADKGRWPGNKPVGAKDAKRAGTDALELFTYDDLAEVETDPNLPRECWDELLDWLGRQQLLFHNAKFDLHMLRTGTRHWPGRDLEPNLVWDTLLVCGAVWPGEGANLKKTAERLWGYDEGEEQRALRGYLGPGSDPRYDLVPWDVMGPYATKDAELTVRLQEEQQQAIYGRTSKGIPRAEREGIGIAHRLTRVLYRVERRGMPYDAAASRQAARTVESARVPVAAELERLWGRAPTTAAAADWFYSHGAQPIYDEQKGQYTRPVSIEHTRDWIRAGIPGAAQWRRYVQLGQMNSMHYTGYAELTGRDGRLRTDFKQATVRSGRMSVGRVQLQAIPKYDKSVGLDGVPHPRDLFFRGPGALAGYRPYNLDLSQAELRVATKLAGCHTMARMLAEGADIHTITTEAVFGVTKDDTPPAEFKALRDIAKRLTFGSIFQIGGKRFQWTLKKLADVDWPLDRCEAAVQAWRRTYPEFKRAYYSAMEFAAQHRYVELVSGRKSWMKGPRDYPNSAWNRIVQASLADWVVRWLHDVEEQTRQYDALVMTVHDSVVLYLPEDIGPELCSEVAQKGAASATEEFGIEMKVDEGPWLE
jgi:DNA polymerase I-like protein with 3'-5' exonuclease and polymerase domains